MLPEESGRPAVREYEAQTVYPACFQIMVGNLFQERYHILVFGFSKITKNPFSRKNICRLCQTMGQSYIFFCRYPEIIYLCIGLILTN